ncbi:hypothetical protein JYU34_007406 [Plutella xylostella]|uniref:F-box domain-containing protein n=1 Tax=Plutella xylostella TaxID=51655 RepID=A0ABQ7QQC9_PLUXY|nr:F-box only protein 7-like [Plutella xylostella]KAG7307246.1 hypothetical protein JYU34_007406 [Plutella xylostella]
MKITLEESTTEVVTLPLQKIVERILSENNSVESLQKDLLLVVIIVLMMENGFLPMENGVEIENPIESIDFKKIRSWRSPLGTYETIFMLNGVPSIPIKVIMSPLGAMVMINASIDVFNGETYSVCLPISKYIVSPQASSVPMIFRDLKHFSFMVNDKVVAAVKSRVLSYCGYPSASLLGLPDDLLFKILLYLPINDVITMRKSCKTMHTVMDSENLWHKLFKRDYKQYTNSTNGSWMELYKTTYLIDVDTARRTRQHRAGSLHDHMDYSDFMSHIENPFWDII